MSYIICAMEPLLVIVAYHLLVHTNDKKKDVAVFLLLYASVIIKQIFSEKAAFVMYLPFLAFAVIPTLVYQVQNKKKNSKIILSVFTAFLASDGIISLVYQSLGFTQNDLNHNLKAQAITLAFKILVIFVYIYLVYLTQLTRRVIPEYYVIGSYLIVSLVSTWMCMFVIPDKGNMKYFAYFVQFVLSIAFIVYIIRSLKEHVRKESLGTSVEHMRTLRHDMKAHFGLIFKLVQENKTAELEAYMKELQIEINKSNTCTCSNVVLASIIDCVQQECERQQIDFQYVILTDNIPLSPLKQNIVLQNILTNAVESCLRCKDNKFIHLTVRPTDYQEVLIECTNSCATVNKDLSTLKRNAEDHGIGLKTIQNIVHSKKGKVICEYDNNEFKTTVLLKGVKNAEYLSV